MMNFISLMLGLAFLILIVIIDIKTHSKENGYIPSVITTLFLIMSLLHGGKEVLFSGVVAGLIALLLTDLEFWGGIADFKVFIASGMLFPNIFDMLIFAGVVTIVGFIFKSVMLHVKKDKDATIPFTPVMLFAFIVVALIV